MQTWRRGRYARFFFGSEKEDVWAAALHGLEQNWAWPGGPDSSNTAIPATLGLLERATAASTAFQLANRSDWRAQMYLKRGYYDAYVQARYVRATHPAT